MSNNKRKFLPNVFRGRVIVAVLILIQIAVLVVSAIIGAKYSNYIAISLNLISFLISLRVIMSRTNDAYKLIWIYLILAFPVFGGLLYLVFSIQGSMKLMEPYMTQIEEKTTIISDGSNELVTSAVSNFPTQKTLIGYLSDSAGFPICGSTDTKYYPTGENFYPDLLSALQSAEKYIFLEYFIIGEGKSFVSPSKSINNCEA